MKIELNLDVEVSYDVIPESIGGSAEYGVKEIVPERIMLTSVKCKGIELISLLSREEIAALEEEIMEKDS